MLSFLVLGLYLQTFSVKSFNYSACPGPLELQTSDVMNTFDINMYTGIYYEVAMHDITQDPTCPDPTCITSNKTLNNSIPAIEDAWEMECYGKVYGNISYTYNVTDISAYFTGIVHSPHRLNNHIFNDTVVAKGDIATNNQWNKKQYEWVIEFQCTEETIDGETHVKFVGINFYCMYSHPSQSMMNDMINTAYQQGLGEYLNSTIQIVYVPQNNCTYPWNITDSE